MLDMALNKFAATDAAAGVVVLKIRLETIGEDFFRDLGLRQTPTLGVFKNGLEVSRLLRFQSLAQIEAAATDVSLRSDKSCNSALFHDWLQCHSNRIFFIAPMPQRRGRSSKSWRCNARFWR